MNYWLVGAGTWLLSDAIYSIVLYLNAPAWWYIYSKDTGTQPDAPKQSWKKDHWIRVVRAVLAVSIIIAGVTR